MVEDAIIVRQARRWIRKQAKGDMPDELYSALAEGADGLEKRQIKSLAKVSRIVADNGTIRPYNDFKKDWKYTKSIYGHRESCSLCGKRPIVENCVLRDEDADREIIVGNVCAYRYVEITVDNRVLDGEEKKEYLKKNMKEAKHKFNRTTFTQKYPSAMSDLKRYEQMMTNNRFLSQPRKKLWKSIHRNMVKRLMSHGYPSPKLSRQWESFMIDAEEEYQEYCQQENEHQDKIRKLVEERQERRRKMAQEIANKRQEWHEQTRKFQMMVKSLDNLSSWEQTMSVRVAQRIKNQGVKRLDSGYKRFYQEIVIRYALETGDENLPSTPLSEEIQGWDKTRLNGWENDFVKSIIIKAMLNREMTSKQMEIIEKIRKRLA